MKQKKKKINFLPFYPFILKIYAGTKSLNKFILEKKNDNNERNVIIKHFNDVKFLKQF